MALNPPLPAPWSRAEELAGDASTRSYRRLRGDDERSAIQVVYPEEIRNHLVRDLEVRSWCQDHGLRVPSLLRASVEEGWAVLEDFGPTDAAATLEVAAASRRAALVARAVQPLEILARVDVAALPAWNHPLDEERLRWELAGFELWYIRQNRNRRPEREVSRWLDELATAVAGHPRRVCHRDYHLNNLFLLEDGSVGIIDYQDMLIGPESYDAVSLIHERDLPRLVSADDREGWLELWAARTGAGPGWRDRHVEATLQRRIKVLGTFARLAAAGHRCYRSWLHDLERSLVPDLSKVSAPSELMDILLDL